MATPHPTPTRKTPEPTTVDSGQEVLLHELVALRRSEAVLRDFIETSTIGLHWVGVDGTILWVNQAELDLLGYAREEYVGRNIAEFHADEPVIKDILGRLSRGETLCDYPARLRHRDRSIRDVLVNSSVLFEDGKFVHTRCFTRDVTALKQEQDANRLLAGIVDCSDDAIVSEDLTGRITSWNRSAERIFGYTAQEAIGQFVSMLIPDDRQEEEVQIFARLQRGEPVDHFETIRRRKDGKLLNISLTISPIRDRKGRIIGGSKIARDITEGKRAEEALRRSEARWNAAIENFGAGVVIATETEQVIYRNPAARAMHGFASDQAGIGSLQEMTRIFELWTPDGRLLTLDEWPFRRIKRGETLNHLELRLCRLDQGWEKIVSYSGAILESTIHERLLFLSVQDLTDQRKAEQSLRESEERLRLLGDHLAASRDEIRALAASLIRAQEEERRRVSRELHDQICHQLGYLASEIGNLAVSPLAPENLRAHLTAIRARVVKTSQETHHIAYQMHTAILKDLGLVASLNALCRQFSDQYPNITANFKNGGPPTSIPIEVATCLYRVAQESLQNTAKHSGAKSVSVRLGFKKGTVVLTIQDNGAGFDLEAVKGYDGIGLVSMKERAHAANGELTITSQPGRGTQITLEIPLQVSNSQTA